jgi:hypothetical protein
MFCLIVGAILLAAGLLQQGAVLDVVGACFVAFGTICFAQAKRSAGQPRISETQTR